MAVLGTWMTFAAMALVACSSPLVDSTYRGEPLFTFTGQVLQVAGFAPTGAPVRVSLFWSPSGNTTLGAADLIEQRAVSVDIAFPATFAIRVFEPPEARHLTDNGIGVGLVLVYEDGNNNERLDAGELLGGASDRSVIFTRRAIADVASPTQRALSPGFQLVRMAASCGAASCSYPLGAACSGDADCGGGTCLADDLLPGGYCVLLADAAPCVPSESALILDFASDGSSVFLAGCQRDGDCRVAEGYVCDLTSIQDAQDRGHAIGACLPEALANGAGCVSDIACFTDDDCGGAPCVGASLEFPGFCESFDGDCGAALQGLDVGCASDSDCDGDQGLVCDATLRICLGARPVALDITPAIAVRPFCL